MLYRISLYCNAIASCSFVNLSVCQVNGPVKGHCVQIIVNIQNLVMSQKVRLLNIAYTHLVNKTH